MLLHKRPVMLLVRDLKSFAILSLFARLQIGLVAVGCPVYGCR